ncbi:hypothetical protein [Bremerella sp.]|uniref:hypothetical protein n=1 Tax=Bremerella sp. TaxID=2795602 RepID=UPI003919AD27
MFRLCLLSVWVVALTCSWVTTASAEDASIERWDRAVCLVETHIDKENNQKKHEWSTAFLVSDGELVTMIATAHGARNTSRETAVVFRTPSGDSRMVQLRDLYDGEGNPWQMQANADVAVMSIEVDEKPKEAIVDLLQLALPVESIQTTVPNRTTPVELAGFPLGMGIKGFGVQPEVSSIVICGQVASREMPTPAKWGNEMVFIIQLAGAGGISGAPVFLAEESPEAVTVAGMVMGNVREDSTGITMNRIIPGRILVDAVKSSSSQVSP